MKNISFQLINKKIFILFKGPECLEKCPICETEKKPSQIQTNQPTVLKNNKKSNVENSGNDTIHEKTENSSQYVKTINGKFFMVNGANISCKCPRSPNGISKFGHTCDGYIDLVLVRKTSFWNNLRFLLAMSNRNCKIVSPTRLLQKIG